MQPQQPEPPAHVHTPAWQSRIRVSGLAHAIETAIEQYYKENPKLSHAEVNIVLSEAVYRRMDSAWAAHRRLLAGGEPSS